MLNKVRYKVYVAFICILLYTYVQVHAHMYTCMYSIYYITTIFYYMEYSFNIQISQYCH